MHRKNKRESVLAGICFLLMVVQVSAIVSFQAYTPKLVSQGSNATKDGLITYKPDQELTLDPSSTVVTVDYGSEVGGFPFVTVVALEGPAQVELKYSEPFDGLAMPTSDGPWYVPTLLGLATRLLTCNADRLYVYANMNSFRTETFNLTKTGQIESFFLQGGLRWQSLTLLAGSSITIKGIGIRPSVEVKDPNHSLPGSFSTSNEIYQDVWALGARAVQAACLDAKSRPSTWEIFEEGAYIRGQQPAVSVKGANFAMYTLEFYTKITSGGTGWRVAAGINGGYGAYFILTSNGPEMENHAWGALPRNQLTTSFGYSIVQQAILPSSPTQNYTVHHAVEEDEWHKITTVIQEDGYVVSLNDSQIAFVNSTAFQDYNNGAWGSGSVTAGTFGFGPFLNQAAWFKNVKITAQDGTVIYRNSLMSLEALQEYAIDTNNYAVCLDGAKRDGEIWIGDYAHTGRSIAASTGRFDYMKSMIDFEFDFQLKTGPGKDLVPMQSYMGTGPQFAEAYYPVQYGETDYFFFFLLALGDYFAITNDKTTMRRHWGGTKALVDSLVSRYLDQSINLMGATSASWFTAQGGQNATAPTCLFATALAKLIRVASALGDDQTRQTWTLLLGDINKAINSLLWNEELGFYCFQLSQPNVSAILATAFPIQAGIASVDQATRSIHSLADSLLQIGYKDTSAASNDGSTQLSPNTQGFLLESLFQAHLQLRVPAQTVLPAIRNLTERFWPKMVTQNQFYTGASWEYLYQDGSPGIGIFTSLSHPWGGAPTYVYTNYILGVRTEWNEKDSQYDWIFDPAWEIAEGLGLHWAKGTVPLPGGGYIKAEWSSKSTLSKAQNFSKMTPSMTASVVGNSEVKVQIKG